MIYFDFATQGCGVLPYRCTGSGDVPGADLESESYSCKSIAFLRT